MTLLSHTALHPKARNSSLYSEEIPKTNGSVTGTGKIGLHLSMGFDAFLRKTNIPAWYPLSNIECSQAKIMNLLRMKRNHKGEVGWDRKGDPHLHSPIPGNTNTSSICRGIIPMEPRGTFRVGVIGAGIAGLACAMELLLLSSGESNGNGSGPKVDMEVVLLEGRSRVGGRIFTDCTSFESISGSEADNNCATDIEE